MANIEVKLKKPFVHYGVTKKAGEIILVDPQQITRLVKRGWIEDPNPTKVEPEEVVENKKGRGK